MTIYLWKTWSRELWRERGDHQSCNLEAQIRSLSFLSKLYWGTSCSLFCYLVNSVSRLCWCLASSLNVPSWHLVLRSFSLCFYAVLRQQHRPRATWSHLTFNSVVVSGVCFICVFSLTTCLWQSSDGNSHETWQMWHELHPTLFLRLRVIPYVRESCQ